MKKTVFFLLLIVICCLITIGGCTPTSVTVHLNKDKTGAELSGDLYGLFIEDISFACDGGLVRNLIANTGFEYEAAPLCNWVSDGVVGTVEKTDGMNENNPAYCRLNVDGKGTFSNKGCVEYYKYLTSDFQKGLSDVPDMGFKEGVEYHLTFYVKNVDFTGKCFASLLSEKNGKDVPVELPVSGGTWQKVTAVLPSKATEDGGLKLTFEGQGTLYVDAFELVGSDSYGWDDTNWKYVSLRADLYRALQNLNPAFVRFPGGCLAEGTSLESLYNWKETVGPLSERKHYVNIWNDDANGLYYDNTNAMGYHEYFQLSEDLGAKALPILNAGTICQFQMKKDGKDYFDWEKEHRNGMISDEEWERYLDEFALRPGTARFDAYVQDILDLIEYANGDKTTVWGSKRAENGHEEPFNLQFIGIGNENWGDLYWRNFDAIYRVLKQKAPEITVISSAGPFFDGKEKEEAYETIDENYLDTLVDEHYYLDGEKMFRNSDFYDDYPRGRQVFVGEYATTCAFFGKYLTKNNLWAAIEEAGYMCGFERNGDVVKMASYAPTFAKINAQRWKVNLIWFDSQNIVLTPNYFVQQLYANNVGKKVLVDDLSMGGVNASATVDDVKQVVYYKVVNSNERAFRLDLDLSGFGQINASSVQYISDDSKAACNELGSTTVVPEQKDCKVDGNTVSVEIERQSVNVIRVCYGANDGTDLYALPALPDTMESNVTEYKKPYLTRDGLIALCVCAGAVVLVAGFFALWVVVGKLKNKYGKITNNKKE